MTRSDQIAEYFAQFCAASSYIIGSLTFGVGVWAGWPLVVGVVL